MLRGLIIYPRFLFENPNSRQLECLLLALQGKCDIELLTLPGPIPEKAQSLPSVHYVKGYTARNAYIGEFIKHHLSFLSTIPDEFRWSVNPLLYASASKLLKEVDYDFILTLSYPLSTHLVGEKLRRHFNVPWIALFYDPWTDNPYRHLNSTVGRKIDANLESKVAAKADACVFTNETMRQMWRNKYRDISTFSLPFCYTEEMMNSTVSYVRHERNAKVRLLYAGISNDDRNLHDLIQAVGELARGGYLGLERMEVSVTGMVYSPDKSLVENMELNRFFSFKGRLEYKDLLREYRESDIYIVVDPVGKVNVHFPSKLMEYFFYQRPILGITPSVGGTADLLRASGHTIINNGDIEGIKSYLKQILEKGVDSLSYDTDFYKQFSPERVSSQFMEIVNSVV